MCNIRQRHRRSGLHFGPLRPLSAFEMMTRGKVELFRE